MHKIKYEIVLNEDGRPVIKMLSNENKKEDKFFVFEMTRYFLQRILEMKAENYDKNSIDMMDITIRLLGQIGDEMAAMIWDMMVSIGEADVVLKTNTHHIVLDNKEALENFGLYYLFNEKIYLKQEGLRVLLADTQDIYEYNEGEFKKQ